MLDRQVTLHPLTFVEEGHEVLVGRPDIESYAVFPADGAELVRRLHSGSSLADAVDWYQRTYQETVDIEDLLETLRSLGFVRDADQPAPAPSPVPFRRLGRAVFSPAAWAGYALLFGAAVASMITDPAVRPTPGHVFFTRSLVIIQIALVATEIPLLFLHEAFHVLAGRRLGLSSRLGIGRRLYFVVFQTTLTKLFSVPRSRRYLPLLAGMVADLVVLSGLVLAAEVDRLADGTVSVGGRLAVAAAYLTAVRFCWQFLFFLETDVHHVLATALGCTDLRGMTRAHLRARFWRRLGRPERAGEEPYLSPHDRAVLRWFAPVTAAGTVVLVAFAAAAGGPVIAGLVTRVADGIVTTATSPVFWDRVVALVLLAGQVVLLVALAIRDRRARRRAAGALQ